jgi:hypothetical protein
MAFSGAALLDVILDATKEASRAIGNRGIGFPGGSPNPRILLPALSPTLLRSTLENLVTTEADLASMGPRSFNRRH